MASRLTWSSPRIAKIVVLIIAASRNPRALFQLGNTANKPLDLHRRARLALRCDTWRMLGHVRSPRPALITAASESPDDELARRRKRYAVMAVVCIASFTAGGLAHRDTVLALLLCGVAMITLPAAVVIANVRCRPRRPRGLDHFVDRPRQLPGRLGRQPGDDR